MTEVHITNGVVFDPFALTATGFVRRNRKPKISVDTAPLFEGLHGEAKFKQAFINACHFAESMTVIGPVANLVWDLNSPSVVDAALRWPLDLDRPNNLAISNQFTTFLTNAVWDSVDEDKYVDKSNKRFMLSSMPDCAMSSASPDISRVNALPDNPDDAWNSSTWSYHMYNSSVMRGGTRTTVSGKKVYLGDGSPMLGVMAVIFTFKKPVGDLGVNELTNLGDWPPVVFLIPTLMPARASFYPESPGGGYIGRICNHQPSIASYQIALDQSCTIMPFGQPFKIWSVDKQGKSPDILRSLSDVYKALWSQATLYSAWNTQFNLETEREPVGDVFLEPMGAGRRIRGHNRFASKYALRNVEVLSEDYADSFIRVQQGKMTSLNMLHNKSLFLRQSSSIRSGQKTAMFVLPSYFADDTTSVFHPIAHAVTQYMFTSAGLEVFVNSEVTGSKPQVTDTGDRLRDPQKSYLDHMTEAMGAKDMNNLGARPIHRVAPAIEFDPEGNPTVFGLRSNLGSLEKMREVADREGLPSDYEKIRDETEVLDSFKFMEAFTSSSTQDLTSTFKPVTEPKKKKTVKSVMHDENRINLFEEVDDMF